MLSENWAGHEFGGVRNRGARWRGDDRRLSCLAVRPPKVAAPFQVFVFLIAGWIHRRQQLAIAYLQAENRVLRERLGTGRLRFTDAERKLLAEKGEGLGRTMLAELATLATPETILRWYRGLIAAKYDGSKTRRAPGRPPTASDVTEQLLTMARESPSWGYTRQRADDRWTNREHWKEPGIWNLSIVTQQEIPSIRF